MFLSRIQTLLVSHGSQASMPAKVSKVLLTILLSQRQIRPFLHLETGYTTAQRLMLILQKVESLTLDILEQSPEKTPFMLISRLLPLRVLKSQKLMPHSETTVPAMSQFLFREFLAQRKPSLSLMSHARFAL